MFKIHLEAANTTEGCLQCRRFFHWKVDWLQCTFPQGLVRLQGPRISRKDYGRALPPQIRTFPDPPLPQAAVHQNQSHIPDERSHTICSRSHQYQQRPPLTLTFSPTDAVSHIRPTSDSTVFIYLFYIFRFYWKVLFSIYMSCHVLLNISYFKKMLFYT